MVKKKKLSRWVEPGHKRRQWNETQVRGQRIVDSVARRSRDRDLILGALTRHGERKGQKMRGKDIAGGDSLTETIIQTCS